jgi:hypothetical protein
MAKTHSIGNDRAKHLLMLAHLAQSQEGDWRGAIDDLVDALDYIVEQTTDPERVIFRKFPHNGDVIALFPDQLNERTGDINSYMHNGQHAETAPDFGDTKAAEPHEYRLLQQELETSFGYRLRPVKRFGKLGRS